MGARLGQAARCPPEKIPQPQKSLDIDRLKYAGELRKDVSPSAENVWSQKLNTERKYEVKYTRETDRR